MGDWLAPLMSLLGAIIGAVISLIVTIFVNKQNLKASINRLKLDIYLRAIDYIKQLKKIKDCEKLYMLRAQTASSSNINDLNEISELISKEGKIFENFYYFFALIAPDKVVKEFEELRNEIQKDNDKDLSYFLNKIIFILRKDLCGSKSLINKFANGVNDQI